MRQRHAPLVRIDRVRGAAHAHYGQRLHGDGSRDGEGAADGHRDCVCGAEDLGTDCGRVVLFVEEVGGREDLRVPVVGGAAGAAEAAAAGHYGGVGEEDGGGAGGEWGVSFGFEGGGWGALGSSLQDWGLMKWCLQVLKVYEERRDLIGCFVNLLIVPWDRYWCHLRKNLRVRIPELRCILRCVVGEYYGVGLPAYYEHLAVG